MSTPRSSLLACWSADKAKLAETELEMKLEKRGEEDTGEDDGQQVAAHQQNSINKINKGRQWEKEDASSMWGLLNSITLSNFFFFQTW